MNEHEKVIHLYSRRDFIMLTPPVFKSDGRIKTPATGYFRVCQCPKRSKVRASRHRKLRDTNKTGKKRVKQVHPDRKYSKVKEPRAGGTVIR